MNASTPETVSLLLGGRRYGEPTISLKDREYLEPAPQIGAIFIEDIVRCSAILALAENAGRSEVFAAYGKDLESLATRRREADDFMHAVLEAGMSRFSLDYERRATEWKMLEALLEPLGITAQIKLTAERSALPLSELVDFLKSEFRREADRIARRVAVTLHYLADHNVIGLVDWMSADVCKFHYFSWSAEHDEKKQHRLDPAEAKGWVTYTTVVTNTTVLSRTRHTHHLMDAGFHKVDAYKRPMPGRVKTLIGKAPAWLKQNLLVVDGTETLAEEVTTIHDRTTTQSTVSVLRYDPALCLGNFVLAGWNDTDVDTADSEESGGGSQLWPIWVILGFFVVSITLMAIFTYNDRIQELESYHAYLARTLDAASGRKELVAAEGERLVLPGSYPLSFGGFVSRGGGTAFVRFVIKDGNGNEIASSFALKNVTDGVFYGAADLRSDFGIPAVVNVRSVGGDGLHYTVTEALLSRVEYDHGASASSR